MCSMVGMKKGDLYYICKKKNERKYMHRLLFLLLIIQLFCSCSIKNNQIMSELIKSEELMMSSPDSSFFILKGIDPTEIAGKKSQALYALLLSQAMDKNWIDEVDDSLIMTAVNYYRNSNDAEHKFLSYYYLGRVQQNSGNLAKALVSFAVAEEMAGQISDNYSIGLLYAQFGRIYQTLYDYPKSIESFSKACHFYDLANKSSHKVYAKLSLAQLYKSVKQYDKSYEIISEIITAAYDSKDVYLTQQCVQLLFQIYEQQGDMQGTKSLLTSKYVKLCNDDLMLMQAKAYAYALQKSDSAKLYMSRAWKLARNSSDSAQLYFREYKLNKFVGKHDVALKKHEKVLYIQDTIVRKNLQQPILTAQKDYYQTEYKVKAQELKQSKNRLAAFICISVAVIIMLVIAYRYRIRVKQKQIESYIDKIYNLESSLLAVNEEADSAIVENVEMRKKINSLFGSQFNLIDKLCTTYYETQAANKDKDAIYTQVRNEIEKLQSNRKHIMQLEKIINLYMDNVVARIRETVPQMTEMEIRLCCFYLAGFSAKAISVFTNDSIGNIYMKKVRMKAKISESDSKDKDVILEYFF